MVSSKDIDDRLVSNIIFDNYNTWSVYLLIRYVSHFAPHVLVIDMKSLMYCLDSKSWMENGVLITPREVIDKKVESKTHMDSIKKCELKYPIIMDQFGNIIDGNHRLAKAYMKGAKTIKVHLIDESIFSLCRIGDGQNPESYKSFEKLNALMTRKVLDCVFKVRFLKKDCPKYTGYNKALEDANRTPGKKIKGGSMHGGGKINIDVRYI